jgi:hypothetical protein
MSDCFPHTDVDMQNQNDPTRRRAIEAIRGALLTLKPKPELVLVILSNGDKHIYAGLKHLCDVQLDVHTVCVHAEKIRREKGQVQYYANVALKVNMKLGGVNHGLDPDSMRWLKAEPTMLVGMDVTHPGPGSLKGTPSIAAVVASVDEHYAQFPASLNIQETRKEVNDVYTEYSSNSLFFLIFIDDNGSERPHGRASRSLPREIQTASHPCPRLSRWRLRGPIPHRRARRNASYSPVLREIHQSNY